MKAKRRSYSERHPDELNRYRQLFSVLTDPIIHGSKRERPVQNRRITYTFDRIVRATSKDKDVPTKADLLLYRRVAAYFQRDGKHLRLVKMTNLPPVLLRDTLEFGYPDAPGYRLHYVNVDHWKLPKDALDELPLKPVAIKRTPVKGRLNVILKSRKEATKPSVNGKNR